MGTDQWNPKNLKPAHRSESQAPRHENVDTAEQHTNLSKGSEQTLPAADKINEARLSAYSSEVMSSLPKPITEFRISTSLPIFALDGSLSHAAASNDAAASKPVDVSDVRKLSPDAQLLIGMAKGKIERAGYPHTEREYAQFTHDVKTFEDNSRANGLSTREISDTLKDVQRILSSVGPDGTGATADGVRTDRQRTRVAEQLMNMAARPEDRHQGEHDTCAMATVEGLLLTGVNANPSSLSKMVADVTLTGRTNVNGIESKVDRLSLQSHGEMSDNRAAGDDKQRLAENIFRLAAANLYYGMQRAAGNPEGQLSYVSRGDKDYVRYTPDPPGGLAHSKKLAKNNDSDNRDTTAGEASTSTAESKILNKITGKDYSKRIMTNGSESEPESLAWVTKFSTPKQLDEHLQQLKKDGQYPVVIDVFQAHKQFAMGSNPFDPIDEARNKRELDHSMQEVSNTYFGRHSLLLTDRQEGPYGVSYVLQNTAGPVSKMEIAKDDLFFATGRPTMKEVISDLDEWKSSYHEGAERLRDGRYVAGLLTASGFLVDSALSPAKPAPPEFARDEVESAKEIKHRMSKLSNWQQKAIDHFYHDKKEVSKEELDLWKKFSK